MVKWLELEALDTRPSSAAEVDLFFGGSPAFGRRTISSDFSSRVEKMDIPEDEIVEIDGLFYLLPASQSFELLPVDKTLGVVRGAIGEEAYARMIEECINTLFFQCNLKIFIDANRNIMHRY